MGIDKRILIKLNHSYNKEKKIQDKNKWENE